MRTNNYEVVPISPKKIDFDPTNPRNESPNEIDQDEAFERLKESVSLYGVLVPIVVRHQRSVSKPYRLVDGERRVRAAIETNQPTIHARIAEGEDPIDDLKQAFHIHMLRKQWDDVAQARALKRILSLRNLSITGKASSHAMEELEEITGCTPTQLRALLRAARYSDAVLDEVDAGKIRYSHLVQNEESLIELVPQLPQLRNKFRDKDIRTILTQKIRKKVIDHTRALMYTVAPVIARATTPDQKQYAATLIEEFLSQKDASPAVVLQKFEHKYPNKDEGFVSFCTRAIELAQQLHSSLRAIDSAQLAVLPELRDHFQQAMKSLKSEISKKIRQTR